ncbi:MAG: hypothetical protein JSV42_02840 [Chloroflexota bacterium]|nr:MAG: hypothetical protein JSV42_02840 [Chloroflexota bacterium]
MGPKDKKKEKPKPKKFNIHQVGTMLENQQQQLNGIRTIVLQQIDKVGVIVNDLYILQVHGFDALRKEMDHREEMQAIQREARQRAEARLKAERKEGKTHHPQILNQYAQQAMGDIIRERQEASQPPKPPEKPKTIHEAVADLPKEEKNPPTDQ